MPTDLSRAFEQVTAAVGGGANLIATLEVVDTLNEMVEGVHPVLRCPPTCSRCCNYQLFVSEEEWALVLRALHADAAPAARRRIVRGARRMLDRKRGPLARALRARDLEAMSAAIARLNSQRRHTCVLLSADGRCTAYAGRPMLCRAYGRVTHTYDEPMLCKIFTDRLHAAGRTHHDLQLTDFGPVRDAYLRGGPDDLRWSALAVFVLLHAADDGDLRPDPAPLPRDGSWPALTRFEMARL